MLHTLSSIGTVNNFGVKIKRKDGSWFFANMNVSIVKREEQEFIIAMIEDVTKKVQTEQALQNQITLVDGLLNAATETVEIFDANTLEYIKWNKSFSQVTGYSDEEIASMSPVTDFILETDISRAEAGMEKLLRTGFTIERLVQVNKDGSQIPFEYTGAVTRDIEGNPIHCIVIGRDISKHIQAERALLESEQLLQAALDALSASIAIIDENGIIQAVNNSWRLFADENNLVWDDYGIGRSYIDSFDSTLTNQEDDMNITKKAIRELISGQRTNFNMEYPCHSPIEERWFMMRGNRFDKSTSPMIVISHEDITMQVNARQQIKEQTAVAERERLALDLHDTVTQSLYSMTLQTDSTLVALSSGKNKVAEHRLDILKEIAQDAMAEMRVLIYQLQPSIIKEKGLAEAINRRLELVENRSGINVDFQIDGESNLSLEKQTIVFQVIQEGLNNVIKHARAKNLLLDLRYEPGKCRLAIEDDGVGFKQEEIGPYGGYGLKSMKKRLYEINGTIQIVTSPGSGTILNIEVPYE